MKKAILLVFFISLLLISTLPGAEHQGSVKGSRGVEGRIYYPLGAGRINAYYIDRDGDGYGVASPLGPDADDGNASVNTPDSIGDPLTFIREYVSKYNGYVPGDVYFISNDGDDSSGERNNVSRPYRTWEYVQSLIKPGDVAVFRGGNYGYIEVNLHGSRDSPITIMGYPGETVRVLDGYISFNLNDASWIHIDGFVCDYDMSFGEKGAFRIGVAENVTVRHVEAIHHKWGIFTSHVYQNNVTIEDVVIHDNSPENGLYIDGWNNTTHENGYITVRGAVIYCNGGNGIQFNGIYHNATVENCIIHSNNRAGIILINGVYNSTFRNNLIFNNNKQGFVLYHYTADQYIQRRSEDNNLFINNIVWLGNHSWNGDTNPAWYPAVTMNEADDLHNFTYRGNVFRNNVFVTYGQPVFYFAQYRHFPNTTIENNVFYRQDGGTILMTSPRGDWTMEDMEENNSRVKSNILEDPLFENVSTEFYLTPELFDFDYQPGSPAIDFGSSNSSPPADMRNFFRDVHPDAGCYEYGSAPEITPPVADAGDDFEVVDSDNNWFENVTLDASRSVDDVGISHYVWRDITCQYHDLGKNLGSGMRVETSLDLGVHIIGLWVWDDEGTVSYDTVRVTVREAPNVVVLQNGYENYSGAKGAMIFSYHPDTNYYGVSWATGIGYYAGVERWVIRFEKLTDILNSTDANNQLVRAYFRMYQYQNDDASGNTIEIHSLNRSFIPQEVTWNRASNSEAWNQPGASSAVDANQPPLSKLTLTEENNLWRTWNITEYVERVREGEESNYGLLIRMEDESSGVARFMNPFDPCPYRRPMLILIFEEPLSLTITTTLLPDGYNGTEYSATLHASGGEPPYEWSITNGTLPPGLVLNGSSGEIGGIPTRAGTYSFTVTVQDSGNNVTSREYIIQIREEIPEFSGFAPTLFVVSIALLIACASRAAEKRKEKNG